MIDVSGLSDQYVVRALGNEDIDEILALCRENTQFYRYSEAEPEREQIISDMHITPPGVDASRKYYVGFYQDTELIAVMDIIDGYPTRETAYIGFFMMRLRLQGRRIGSAIIDEVKAYLRTAGKTAVRLAINKGNPQATRFWQKNGFAVIREVDRNGWPLLEAECAFR